MSFSHVVGSVVSVVGASTVQGIALLKANQCARGWSVWWVELLKTVSQFQWSCCRHFWCECVDSVSCASGVPLCDRPGVLVAG